MLHHNRCQKEFERDTGDDKKLKERWLRNILYVELTYWLIPSLIINISRFIGELYKLDMLITRIMHDVLRKLLKSNPSEESQEFQCSLADWSSDQRKLLKSNPSEESLECLCRLADWSSDQQEIFCNLIILKVVDNCRTGPGQRDQREAQ